MNRINHIMSHINIKEISNYKEMSNNKEISNIISNHVAASSTSTTTNNLPISKLDSSKFVVRKLELSDYKKGFLSLLSQLTVVGDISEEQFKLRFNEINNNQYQHIYIIEDLEKHVIIGSATLYIELKFIRSNGKIGHIEDVVVNSDYRGKNLGLIIIDRLKYVAKEKGCYKIILNCSDKNITFYQKLGFEKKENQMAVYLNK